MTEGQTTSGQAADLKFAACLASGADLSKFEQFKADSCYLLDPLAAELENSSDHFSNDAVQLLKFHGSYQQDNRDNRQKGEGKDWQMMLRLRSPGGRIPPSLFLALDDLSNRLGNGSLRATTRQAFQIHGVRKEDLREVISTIIRSMGSTLAACGDITRNVMAPAAPYEKGGAREDVLIDLTSIHKKTQYIGIICYNFTNQSLADCCDDASVFVADPSKSGNGPGGLKILCAAALKCKSSNNLAGIVVLADGLRRLMLCDQEIFKSTISCAPKWTYLRH